MEKAKIIAFYLPQYYPFKENDEWWGKGFTEWTNLAKARKLFPGHEQPKLPGELGFYDLRLEETRIAQAELAKKYGVDGFCYYYYRLNKNLHLMDRPLKEMYEFGKPDFPFMLCWANHNWEAKDWNSYDSFKSKMLAVQEYGDEEDVKDYFYEILPYFKDARYIKVDNCPLFSIYRPLNVPKIENFISIWNKLAKENGFDGVKFIGYTEELKFQEKKIREKGVWNITSCRMNAVRHNHSQIKRYIGAGIRYFLKLPYIISYKKVIKELVSDDERQEDVNPVIMPNWDPSPRRASYVHLWTKSTPDLFGKHLDMVFDVIKNKKNKLVFIKSWNEWGEGNYLEPDRKWQDAYLKMLKQKREEWGL